MYFPKVLFIEFFLVVFTIFVILCSDKQLVTCFSNFQKSCSSLSSCSVKSKNFEVGDHVYTYSPEHHIWDQLVHGPYGFRKDNMPFKVYGDFAISFNNNTKAPTLVSEFIYTENFVRDKPIGFPKPNFLEDSTVDFKFRIMKNKLKNIGKFGMSRGHQAPAKFHYSSVKNYKITYVLSNMCIQDSDVNKGIWVKVEDFIFYNLIDNEKYKLIVCHTGPLFESCLSFLKTQGIEDHLFQIKSIGNNVSVPFAFFKVCICVSHDDIVDLWIFIVANHSKINEQFSSVAIPIEDFKEIQVDISTLISASGIEFFQNLDFSSLRNINGDVYTRAKYESHSDPTEELISNFAELKMNMAASEKDID